MRTGGIQACTHYPGPSTGVRAYELHASEKIRFYIAIPYSIYCYSSSEAYI